MKQYVIDELRAVDYESLKIYMQEHYGPAAVEGIYWIPLENGLLTNIQKAHRDDCQHPGPLLHRSKPESCDDLYHCSDNANIA